MRGIAASILIFGAACSSTPSELWGEVHIHQFEGGMHPGANFLTVPVESYPRQESVIPFEPPIKTDGPCSLQLSSQPRTVQFPEVADAGTLSLSGDSHTIDLTFKAANKIYYPTVFPLQRFGPNQLVTVRASGSTLPGFAGTIETPTTLALGRVELERDRVTVDWEPAESDHIDVMLAASSSVRADWGIIRCGVADSLGKFSVPSSLLTELPRAPYDLHLEVQRNNVVYAEGVILHTADTVTREAHAD